jgi:hypothetical protein
MKYRSIGSIVSGTASVVLMSNTAIAVTFNGYDLNTSNNPVVPLTKLTAPNSEAAFKTFSDRLTDTTVTTESFEGVAGAINGLSRTISNTTATFSYTQKNPTDPNNPGVPGTTTTSVQKANSAGFTNAGTYPTDGMYGISINSENNFSISFSNSLAAFGYFGTDLGDSGNILTMKFFKGATEVNSTAIPTNTGSANSSEFFFGFIADSPAEEFNRVEFISSISSGGDAIGIDQIKIATPTQLNTKIPEPSSLLGTLLCGGAVVTIKRRLQRARSSEK